VADNNSRTPSHWLIAVSSSGRLSCVAGGCWSKPAGSGSVLPALPRGRCRLEWQRIINDLAHLSEIEVGQDGCRARLRTAPGPSIDPICRAIGLYLPPVFQEVPPAT
jgi:hypothetical protein